MWVFVLTSWAADLYVGPGHPHATLDEAVATSVAGDRILLEPGTWSLSGPLVHTLTLRGIAGPGVTTVVGTQFAAVVDVFGAAPVRLEDLTLDGELERRVVRGAAGTTVTTLRSTVRNGVTSFGGGGIESAGSVVVEASLLQNDTADAGGCVWVLGPSLEVRGGHFEGCEAGQIGGGIALVGNVSTATVTGARFTGGSADRGGAIHVGPGRQAVVVRSRFVGNEATGSAGALYAADGSQVELRDSQLDGNSSADRAGAVLGVAQATVQLERLYFGVNEAGGSGGALYIEPGVTGALLDSTLVGNTSLTVGGALYVGEAFTIGRSAFCDNFSTDAAGALRLDTGPSSVTHTLFLGNSAGSGGALRASEGTAEVRRSAMVGNVAVDGRGAALFAGGDGGGPVPFEDNVVTDSVGTLSAVGSEAWFTPSGNTYFANQPSGAAIFDPSDSVGIDPQITRAGCHLEAPLGSPVWSTVFSGTDGAALYADGVDADGDGWAARHDCNDLDPAIHPEAPETCDGLDSDCDGLDDALDPDAFDVVWFADIDSDGLGRAGTGRLACGGVGLAADETDCDDTNALLGGTAIYAPDGDGDGFGAGEEVAACDAPDGFGPPGDCDDADPAVFPGAVEVPGDGIDQDCDGVDAATVDTDGDGIADDREVELGSDPNATDSDGDGLPDGAELGDPPVDSDGDGLLDLVDPDDDGDGILTIDETDADVDGDGIPNHLDSDSDGDGLLDADEARVDTDGDGIPEYLDPLVAEESDLRGSCGCASPAFRSPGSSFVWVCLGVIAVLRRQR